MKTKISSICLPLVMFLLMGSTNLAFGQLFSDWAAPVNLGPPVDTVGTEYQPAISKDGLSLYFVVLEGNVQGGPQDIWVAKRNSLTDSWGTPQKLGSAVNSASTEGHPFVTIDGHWLYFNSNKPGGFGRTDIYVARRRDKREDFPTDPSGGWMPAVNLGSGVNTNSREQAPCVFEDSDNGVTTLYFSSDRPGGLGEFDIYASTLQPDGTFGPAVLVEELSSASRDEQPDISRDGLAMFFVSNRSGSIPNLDTGDPSSDLWMSTRPSTLDPWSEPVNLGLLINSPYEDISPSLSFDETTLYFVSPYRVGNQSDFFDIWITTRTKLTNGH